MSMSESERTTGPYPALDCQWVIDHLQAFLHDELHGAGRHRVEYLPSAASVLSAGPRLGDIACQGRCTARHPVIPAGRMSLPEQGIRP